MKMVPFHIFNLTYRNMANTDTMPMVVKQMIEQNRVDRPDLRFLQINAGCKRLATLVVIDLDAVLVDEIEVVCNTIWLNLIERSVLVFSAFAFRCYRNT